MSTIERREYHTSRVTRTVSPQRTLSNQNLSEFDNNLDNLLEDLQSSVSRPGSSLGNANTYRETRTTYGSGKGDSLGRVQVQHLAAANPTTIIADDSYTNYKPGETVKTVKTYKENYASYNVNSNISPEKTRMQSNINKLDTLLDDLQQARQGTLDRGISDSGIDPGLLEPAVGLNKQVVSKKTVHRELVYDGDSPRNKRGGSVEREVYVNRELNDGTYGDIRPIRHQSPSPSSRTGTLQKTYNYSSDTHNTVSPQTELVESTKPDINPNILAQLDPNLLPPPNTKVTTTIKTYTYEIPGSGYPSTVSPKLSETVFSSNPSTPSQSFAYNTVENTSTNLSPNYPGSYVRPVSPNPSGHTTTKYVENVTTRNVTNDGYPPLGYNTTPTPGKKTYIYNETTTRNINNSGPEYPHTTAPRSPRSPPPTEKQIHIYNNTTTTNLNNLPPPNDYPVNRYPDNEPRSPPGTIHRTYIVNETNTTRNVISPPHPRNGYPPNQDPGHGYPHNQPGHGYPPNQPGHGYPPNQPGHTTVVYKHDTHSTTNNNYSPNGPNPIITYPDGPDSNKKVPPYGGRPHDRDPRDPNVNITYKYTTHTTSSNNYKGHPNDETEPLLHPRPFPTDPNEIEGPPKQLDKLMAVIGNEPPNNSYNASYNAKEAERVHKKEVDKLTEQSAVSTQKKVDIKDLPKTKNVAGPPVYYPPGHELFSHKEESGGGGYRAEGEMMRESGKYKYEASSSSKTKSSSGVAVVPVCLPLCCGLPCVIM